MAAFPTEFVGVTVVTKANVYFDGNVVSHTVLFKDEPMWTPLNRGPDTDANEHRKQYLQSRKEEAAAAS